MAASELFGKFRHNSTHPFQNLCDLTTFLKVTILIRIAYRKKRRHYREDCYWNVENPGDGRSWQTWLYNTSKVIHLLAIQSAEENVKFLTTVDIPESKTLTQILSSRCIARGERVRLLNPGNLICVSWTLSLTKYIKSEPPYCPWSAQWSLGLMERKL